MLCVPRVYTLVKYREYGWFPPIDHVQKFKENKSDFQNMANSMLELKQNYVYDEITLWIWGEYDSKVFDLAFSSGSETSITLTEMELNYLEGIADTFWDDSLYRIQVTDTRVAFIANMNALAFVYSTDGKKPTYISYEGENFSIIVIKVAPKWYLING
jgi:hypothetical protein